MAAAGCGWTCGGMPLSFRERRAVDEQKSEVLVPAADDVGITTLKVRFRLVAGSRCRRSARLLQTRQRKSIAGLNGFGRVVGCVRTGQASSRHTVSVKGIESSCSPMESGTASVAPSAPS